MGEKENLDLAFIDQLDEALEEREGKDRRKTNLGVDQKGQDRRKGDRRNQQSSEKSA